MSIMALVLGMLLGAMIGSLFHSVFAGLLIGGLLAALLLRGRGGAAVDQALQEMRQLRELLADQQQRFEAELTQLRARMAALEASAAVPVPEPVADYVAEAGRAGAADWL